GPRLETRYKFGPGGAVTLIEQRGVKAEMVPGDVNHKWEATQAEQGKFYILPAETPYDQARLASHLLKQPNHSAPLLPDAQARVEIVADTTVTGPGGSRKIRLAAVSIGSGAAEATWLDERDR